MQFVTWEGRFYRRKKHRLVVVVSIRERERVLFALHDQLGHWDLTATRILVTERFWWPGTAKDIMKYVKTCDACQKMAGPQKYTTLMYVPHGGLFEIFPVDFAGPFQRTNAGNRFFLVCAEHLTGWPIVAATPRAAADIVLRFLKDKTVLQFGPPRTIISDNAMCFTAKILKNYLNEHGITWRTVLSYAPMSNGRAERMVRTIKHGLRRVLHNSGKEWDAAVRDVAYGYCRHPSTNGKSSFQLLYGVKPRILRVNGEQATSTDFSARIHSRNIELLSACALRAGRVDAQIRSHAAPKETAETFRAGDLVLVTHGSVFASAKWPAIQPKLYGPCTVIEASHPRYKLRSSAGRVTQQHIHAQRLVRYRTRN